MRKKRPKYAVAAAFASFLIAGTLGYLSSLIPFGDSSGNSGAVQGYLTMVMALPFIFLFQIINYQILGWLQYRWGHPKKRYCRTMASLLSFPLPALVAPLAFMTTQEDEGFIAAVVAALYSFVMPFLFLWLSFYSGAMLQFLWIVDDITTSSTPTPQSGAR